MSKTMEEKQWLVINIFVKYNPDWTNALQNVWKASDVYRPDLEKIAGASLHFFVHYSDSAPGRVVEPRFKFCVKHPQNEQEFRSWVFSKKNNDDIKEIIIEEEVTNESYEEAGIARKNLFDIAMPMRGQLSELKTFLRENDEYKKLNENKGRHFLRNMLKLTYKDERLFSLI